MTGTTVGSGRDRGTGSTGPLGTSGSCLPSIDVTRTPGNQAHAFGRPRIVRDPSSFRDDSRHTSATVPYLNRGRLSSQPERIQDIRKSPKLMPIPLDFWEIRGDNKSQPSRR